MDSTENIARRYRHLFRLPSTRQSVIYASIPAIAIELLTRFTSRGDLTEVAFFAMATELLLLLSIEIDHRILRRRTKLAIFRRLSSLSIITNFIWLLVAIVASALTIATRNDARFLALIILGMSFSIAFRALVFGSIFFDRPSNGLPTAAIQPIILIFPIALLLGRLPLSLTGMITSVTCGLISIVAVELYIRAVNKKVDFEGFRSLELFQAFLKAWIIEDASVLEHFLEMVSKERVVDTTMINLATSNAKSVLLVVPGIHPGPFYPVGSSNLPFDIYEQLRTDHVVPLTVHSISDHDLNLSSKSEVEHYIDSLKHENVLDNGKTMSLPIVKRENKATVSGFAFGSTALVALTLAPYGMEDFPVEVRKKIEEISREYGFKCEFIIDTHNSEGAKPNQSECRDVVEAAKYTLQELKNSKQYRFGIGLAHSSEVSRILPKDVGPAGVGLIRFEVEGSSFYFVVVDANNSKIGFREEVFKKFEQRTGSRILELCTSDTHVTAAKTLGAKGYVALGDSISSDDFVSLLTSLDEKTRITLGECAYSTLKVTSKVKTIGAEVLNEFSGLVDKTSQISKKGALALGILTLLLIIAVAAI